MGVRTAKGPDSVSKPAMRKLWNMRHESCMLRQQETVCLECKRQSCHVTSRQTHRLDRSPMLHIHHPKQHVCVTCRNAKWRERRSRVDKDVHRTDRQQPFFSEPRSHNTKQLRNILLTYVQYNHDLGYCQVGIIFLLHVIRLHAYIAVTSSTCTATPAVHTKARSYVCVFGYQLLCANLL
jgi:hypothetical protein